MGAPPRCASLYSMCDLKVTSGTYTNKFELGHSPANTTKNICYAKIEGKVDHCTVTRWFKKFPSGCKKLVDHSRLSRSKSVESNVVLQILEANPVSSARRVSGELDISLSRAVRHFLGLDQSIRSCCRIVPHVNKILQNFWLTRVLFANAFKFPLNISPNFWWYLVPHIYTEKIEIKTKAHKKFASFYWKKKEKTSYFKTFKSFLDDHWTQKYSL